jgi:hypothetical protein
MLEKKKLCKIDLWRRIDGVEDLNFNGGGSVDLVIRDE